MSNVDTIAHENYLPVTIGNIQAMALVDTGASISVVSQTLVNNIKCDRLEITDADYQAIIGVGGERHNIINKVVLSLNIGDTCISHAFHVLQGHHMVILGMDFLKAQGVIVNLEESSLTLRDGVCVRLQAPAKQSCLARATRALALPPHSVRVIATTCSKRYKDPTLVLFEPTTICQQQPSVCLMDMLVAVKGKRAVCRIVNTGNEVAHIKKGQTLMIGRRASMTEIMSVDDPPRLERTTTPDNKAQQMPSSNDQPAFNIGTDTLSTEQVNELKKLLHHHQGIFTVDKSDLGRTTLEEHVIDTGGAQPTAQRFYRQSPQKRAIVHEQIQALVQQGLLEPSTSRWTSPVVLVKKKDGAWRFCGDYRKLNSVTKPQSFPLPRLEDVWDMLGDKGASIFSVCDVSAAYWQIPMHPDSKEKTAIVTPSGQWQWNVLPYGLRNSAATFMSVMHKALQPLINDCIIIYVDDVIIFSENFEEHTKHLAQVFKHLEAAGLRLKPSKCHFAKTEVQYLGHVLSASGVKPNPAKTDVVEHFPVPQTQKEVRSFLGLTNYYRRFVKGYSMIAAPMTKLLSKDVEFSWSEECEKAFNLLKQRLITAPILGFPDMCKSFVLTTDASGTGLGFILSQKGDDSREIVIMYGGRSLHKAEKNYTVTEIEALAVVYAVQECRVYLADKEFLIVTDHQCLQYLDRFKDTTPRLNRWAMQLQSYQYKVCYKKGSANTNADALSRIPWDRVEKTAQKPTVDIVTLRPERALDEVMFIYEGEQEDTIPVATYNVSRSSDPSIDRDQVTAVMAVEPDKLSSVQRDCPEIGPYHAFFKDGTLPQDGKLARKLAHQEEHYVMLEDVLYHLHDPGQRSKSGPDSLRCMSKQVVVPIAHRARLLDQYHDAMVGGGHQGYDRTYYALKHKYFWPRMYSDVCEYIKRCDTCQRIKSDHHTRPVPLTPMPIVATFERWHMDFLIMKETKEGFRYILLLVDSYSRWCEAFPMKSQDAHSVAKVLYSEVITRYGAPRSLVTDRGRQFTSKLIKALCEIFSIKKHFTSSYHPQSNAACERMNSFIAQTIRAYCAADKSDWPSILPAVMMAYRHTPATRSTTFSPFEILFGKSMMVPADVELTPASKLPMSQEAHLREVLNSIKVTRQIAAENVRRNQERYKSAYDKRADETDLMVGQTVLLRNETVPLGQSPKLCEKFIGPYYIIEVCDNYTYRIADCKTHKEVTSRVNANRLKKYKDPAGRKYNSTDPTTVQDPPQQTSPETPSPDDSRQPEISTKSPVGKTVSRIKSCKQQGNSRIYKVIIDGEDGTYDLSPEQVPPMLMREFHARYNLKGRIRSRRGRRPKYINSSAS